MRRCNHTSWLSLCSQGNGTELLVSDRVQSIINYIPDADVQRPSLLVLVGNATKTIALRELFGVKRAPRFSITRGPTEIHLHVDPSSIFGTPMLIADGDLSGKLRGRIQTDNKCHQVTRRAIREPEQELGLDTLTSRIYSQLLLPFADVFCFFCDDIGGLDRVARYLAAWPEHGHASALPASPRPKVVVVIENISLGAESEEAARTTLLRLIREETTRDLFCQISAIDVIALFPRGSISVEARLRPLKERLMASSDQIRTDRHHAQSLFSATHFAALLESACEHFSEALGKPFNFISASRAHNPVSTNLKAHLSDFLKHIKSPTELTAFAVPVIASSFLFDNYPPDAHYFPPREVFKVLYKDILTNVSNHRVMAFEESRGVVLRSGFVNMVERYFEQSVERLLRGSELAAEVHLDNLSRHKLRWLNIHSSSTCLACLRRRPPYELHCGHMICGNCFRIFGECSKDDPLMFTIKQCLLCHVEMPEEVGIRTHPPTAGVGVLCIDGGGVRGIVPLKIMKRICDRIQLPIPFQRFIKVAFGISSGGLIVADMFINGSSIEESNERFEALAKHVFQRREILNIPFFPRFLHPLPSLFRILELLISYFADGLYPSQKIDEALKQVFGADRSILDISRAFASGTLVGLPVATTDDKPTCRIFTNYNGVGERINHLDYVIKPRDGFGKVLLWEIARAASAAAGFFPPKHIHGIGTFQDAGPLENDPLISALSEVAAVFPLIEEPDFVVSLGTGEPKPTDDIPATNSRSLWKNGALPRLCRLFWEKMRDAKVRQAFQSHPRYHRLNVQFDGDEPRLDDVHSIPALKLRAEEDGSLSLKIDNVARCFIASLFYFELDAIPQRSGGKHSGTGHILCSIRHNDKAFPVLFNRLAINSAQFWIDGYPIMKVVENGCFDDDGNFRKRVELNTDGRFAIALKQDASEPCNISGSPFSVEKMILLQGFSAVFGRPDHRKRKNSGYLNTSKRKNRRTA